PTFVLNADDPRIADLARDEKGSPPANVVYFGVEDGSQASELPGIADDVPNCRSCGATYSYRLRLIGHLGHYSCPVCGRERPLPHIAATRIEPRGMAGSRVEVST